MSIGCFIDKKHQPSAEEISAALGPSLPAWEALTGFVRSGYPISETWKFMYGKKYGWALHVERDSKMLVNFYPNQGAFTVQINLPESAVRAVLETALPQAFRQAIAGAFPFPEGRWIFIPCRGGEDLPEFERLIRLRVASRLDKKGK